MDSRTRELLVRRILEAAPGGVLWSISDSEHAKFFDKVVEVSSGKVVQETAGSEIKE
jgi:hypothetical protein